MGWRRFWRRGRRDDELALELESYLEHEAECRRADGLPPNVATLAARKKLGNATRIRERVYDSNSIPIVEWLVRDLRSRPVDEVLDRSHCRLRLQRLLNMRKFKRFWLP